MPKNVDIKRAKILDVAKKRFAHFGMAKTTMAEIAKDLSFSKALLYYYFPDKHSLYTAVMEHVINDMMQKVENYLTTITTVEKAVIFMIETRMDTFRENYNLFEYSSSLFMQNPSEMYKNLGPFFEKERDQYCRILRIGIQNGEVIDEQVDESAELLLFGLMGMRAGVLSKGVNSFLFPSPNDFDRILSKQKRLAHIFLRGLRP
ncbi:TetR/AcrR family transcriptional regulator [Sphingobacterium sp. MYb382]|uniref:TetR/AcrR family transcriptional regulator n=1 Tax=Sphingobacterium sp. MYb382 TaxID=2745278 RepID=UPI0030A09310